MRCGGRRGRRLLQESPGLEKAGLAGGARTPKKSSATGSDGKRYRTIRQTATIDATPAEVFGAYVEPEKHAAFTGSDATGDPRVGGKFTASDGYIVGEYVELEKGKKIVHWWTTSEWPEGYPPSLIELRLRPKGKRTELTMIHTRVPAEQAARYAEGWREYYWKPLREYFANKK